MAHRIVFGDENNNEMDCYLNDEGQVYIGIGKDDDDPIGGHITLDKKDVSQLIKVLQELEGQMEE